MVKQIRIFQYTALNFISQPHPVVTAAAGDGSGSEWIWLRELGIRGISDAIEIEREMVVKKGRIQYSVLSIEAGIQVEYMVLN